MSPNFNPSTPLRRSLTDRYLGGVCGGIAEAYDIDPTIVRITFALLTLAGFSGLPIYLVLWIVMPEEGTGKHIF